MKEKTNGVRGAVTLSVTCVSAYIACYILRNVLSVVTPDMIASGYSTEYIGIISSVYYIVYACGQLINGYVGEMISAKYMVSLGLTAASLSSVLFAFCGADFMGVIIFGIMGFSLSMLRGPIVKTICENTDSKISHIACVFYLSRDLSDLLRQVFYRLLWVGRRHLLFRALSEWHSLFWSIFCSPCSRREV